MGQTIAVCGLHYPSRMRQQTTKDDRLLHLENSLHPVMRYK
jgi:hypothetical protein